MMHNRRFVRAAPTGCRRVLHIAPAGRAACYLRAWCLCVACCPDRMPLGGKPEAVVDVDCNGASRGLLVGFCLGLCLAVLRFGSREDVWQHATLMREPLRSLQPLQPSGLTAPAQRAGTDAPAAASAPAAAPLPPVAACVGGALSLVVPGRGSSVRLGVLEPLGWPDVFVAGTLNGSAADEADTPRWAARARMTA